MFLFLGDEVFRDEMTMPASNSNDSTIMTVRPEEHFGFGRQDESLRESLQESSNKVDHQITKTPQMSRQSELHW